MTVQEAFGITSEELATKIGDLRYDELALLFRDLSFKLTLDSHKDTERGRTKLADTLERIGETLSAVSIATEVAWEIAKPHMKQKAPV